MEHSFIISIGSNSDSKEENVNIALQRMSDIFHIENVSSVYTTPALNGVDPDYCNCVASGTTALSREEIVNLSKQIERNMGRVHSASHKCVPIDLDLVVYDGDVLRPKDFACEYFKRGWSEICQAIK